MSGSISPLVLQFLSSLAWGRRQSICIAIGCSKPDLERFSPPYIVVRPLLEVLAFYQLETVLSVVGLASFSPREYLESLHHHRKFDP